MFLHQGAVAWTATDLSNASECEYSLLRTLDVRLGRAARLEVPEDELSARVAELGDRHEQAELRRLVVAYGEHDPVAGTGVFEVRRPEPFTPENLAAKREQTLEALRQGVDVVFQAAFFDGSFQGFADFLVRDRTIDVPTYTVCDTKLARHEKPKALLQLAAYADQLSAAGVAVTAEVELLLGSGRRASFPLSDIAPVFRERRDRLLAILAEHLAAKGPVAWGDPRFLACGRCDTCSDAVASARDVLMVAGLRISQRKRLADAGVRTIDDLAARFTPVEGMAPRTLANLQAQAALQVQQVEPEEGRPPEVLWVVHEPARLALIPAPSRGDIFFDFEGDPMWNDGDPSDWGLEYLFGVVETPLPGETAGTFLPFWAHDRRGEKRALEDFVDYVVKRRTAYPDMHIYHYAAYERSALTRLALRHGTCEDQVDDLLRAGVLVDLYAVVRGAVRISQPSYSIKKLEPLYMADDQRTGEVKDAAASIVEYHRYCEARDRGETTESARLLGDIADYNRYDCDSTLGLRDWLLARAAEHGVTATEPEPPADETVVEEPGESAVLEQSLREIAGDGGRDPDRQAIAMVAAAVGFNRRELKPFWWAHFERLGSPVEQWPEQRDVFVAEEAAVESDWAKPTPRSNPHRRTRLSGRFGAGSTVKEGESVHSVYAEPVADCHNVPANALLGCSRSGVEIVSIGSDDAGRDVVVIDETLPRRAGAYAAAPVALTPGPPVPMGKIDEAIREVARAVVEANPPDRVHPAVPGQPALDILRRIPPRLLDGGPLPVAGSSEERIFEAVSRLDRSYLAVQGPPGTGKTYVGSHVIARLVDELGWRVGVVAQSHAVVGNMLAAVVEAGVPAARVAKKPGGEGPQVWTVVPDKGYAAFLDDCLDDGLDDGAGCVLGGTAWDFANEQRVARECLDLLVVDEAGQFSLAHTIGASVAARRLMLLGDPQQLPQVSQGTHPEPVDESALGWLMRGRATLPADEGYFLERTWRMHPDLCAKDSALSYAGQLRSHEAVTLARRLEGVAAGVSVVRLRHTGCSTESEDEAAEVVRQVESLAGAPWTDPSEFVGTRPLGPGDFLVVAPYNAQVILVRRALAAAGYPDVRVGTVDKFQGQQAAVVIVSMTASAVEDVPRGMGFLLNRNRVNVAISRGKWCSVVIRSEALTGYLPATPEGLLELGAFIGLCEPA